MKREFQMMLIVVVCAIMGVVSAMIVNTMYTRGQIIDELLAETTITISDLMFVVFFMWVLMGIIIGVLTR